MRPDVTDLQAFYASPLGRQTAALISNRLGAMTCSAPDPRLLAMGYGLPYLNCMGLHPGQIDRIAAVMPARQGVVAHPVDGFNQCILADIDHLPFADSVFDRALLIHCLEFAGSATSVLSEVGRVLAPGGRAICIVPHRGGLWTWSDDTPFGNGRPFSSGQLRRLCERAQLRMASCEMALTVPPWKPFRPFMLKAERLGRSLWPKLGGVYVVEIEKQTFGARKVSKEAQSPVHITLPGLAPAPVPAARDLN